MSQSTYNTSEQQRVNREQEFVKEKGQEVKEDVKETARRVKEGDVSMPTTDKVTSKLEEGEQALDRVKTSERGQNLDGKGEKVVDDLKRVLEDQKVILGDKNEGDILQNMVRHIWALMQEFKQNPQLKEVFEEWQSNVTSIMSSGDFIQFFHQTGRLFTSMKETEEFLSLASELIELAKLLVAENAEKATENDPSMLQDYKQQKELERQRIVSELRITLRSLSYNDMYDHLVLKGKKIGNQVKEAGEATSGSMQQALHRIRDSPNFQELVGEFKTLLQRLVGESLSVEPLFDYSKKAFDDILNNQDLSKVLHELHLCLSELVEDPSLLELHAFQDRLQTLAQNADTAIENIRADPNVVGAREESKKISAAIKNEPASVKLLTDLKTFYHDVFSDKPGQIIDPEVLKNLKGMVVPLLIEHLHNVPLPDISDSFSFLGRTYYTLSDMKISLPELIPENIHMRFEYEMDANLMELNTTNQRTYLYIQADNIQVNLNNVNFQYERKSIPRVHDSGVFDVHTQGHGLTVWMKMKLRSDDSKDGQYLEVLKSDVRVDKFVINFHESKHDKIYEMMAHLFDGRIRKAVVEAARKKLEQFGQYFNEQIYTLISEAKTRSADISQSTKERAEQARKGFERLKIQTRGVADSYIKSSEVEEKKEDAKSTAKNLVNMANDKAQEVLDNQQSKIEQKKMDRQMDKAIGVESDSNKDWKSASPHATNPNL